jgi:hypothetical protein
MQRLQRIFQRAALALGLLTAGIGGGYGLYQPRLADDAACAPTARVVAAGARAYVLLPVDDSASLTASHAPCSCGSA